MITALVCTRNRPDKILQAVRSILSNTHPQFELIVLDQSTDDRTETLLAPLRADKRLRYLRSDSQGLGLARNLGLAEARGEIVAMTDDDCEVPTDWLEKMEAVFTPRPQVAVAFCEVEAVEHDPSAGFVPAFSVSESRLLTQPRDLRSGHGIGAGMAVRRSLLEQMGGFDATLGAGGLFPSYEDGDIALRALLKGYHVYYTDSTTVLHDGFRSWSEGQRLAMRDWVGIGAGHAKLLRCGHRAILAVALPFCWNFILFPIFRDTLRLKRPRVLTRLRGYLNGFFQGWRTPVDRQTCCFVQPQSSGSRKRARPSLLDTG